MYQARTRKIVHLGLSDQEGRLQRRISGGSVVQWNGWLTVGRQPNEIAALAQLEAENAELRARAVELALAIQDLRDGLA
jgi:cell division protein FtsB